MATEKRHPLKNLLNATLTFVRGPMFLSVLSVVLLAVAIPAQATLLHGYLQSSAPTEAQKGGEDIALDAIGAEASGTNYISPEEAAATDGITPQALTAKTDEQQEAGKLHRAMLKDNSFPQTFAGWWKCVTVVVDSAVSTIPVGQRVESAISFEQLRDGRVIERWEQPGWTETASNVTPISTVEVALERTNFYRRDGRWAAHSRDRYLQIDANRIAADSQVEQFVDGQFLGRYQTKSMLYRMTGNIAMR